MKKFWNSLELENAAKIITNRYILFDKSGDQKRREEAKKAMDLLSLIDSELNSK